MRLQARVMDIRKIFPVMGIFDCICVNVKGELTIGYELTLPVAYTMDERDYDSLVECMCSAIRVLPPWTVIHRQDIYTRSRYNPEAREGAGFLSRSYDEHFRGRGYMEHRAYLFITASSANGVDKPGRNSGLFGFSSKNRYDVSSFASFLSKCKEFTTILESSTHIKCRTLTQTDWLGNDNVTGIIQKYMMFGNDSDILSDVEFTPSSVSVYGKTAVAFNIASADSLPTELPSVSRIDSLSIPGNDVYLSLGAKIGVMLDCEHVINQTIVLPSQEELLHAIDSERKKMSSGISSSDNRINSEELQYYLDEVYRKGLVTVKCNMNVIAWDSDARTDDVISRVSSALTSMSVVAVFNRLDTPIIWYAGIPGCAFEIGKENLMTQALTPSVLLSTFETFPSGLKDSNFMICDRMRNVPLGIDTMDRARDAGLCGNYNGVIFGGSGTGKSFFTNSYVRNNYDNGASVFIIDVGDSYEGLCGIIREESSGADGQYLSWDVQHPFSFSAFNNWQQWLNHHGGLHTDMNEVQFLLSFLQTLYIPSDGWPDRSKTILIQIVIDFIKDWTGHNSDRSPLFNDFYKFVNDTVAPRIKYAAPEPKTIKDPAKKQEKIDALNRTNGYYCDEVRITEDKFNVEDFILSMKSYAQGGSYAFLLNNPNPADLFSSRFVVFEVDKLSQDDRKFYSLCILCMMNAFDQKMRSSEGRKMLVIEEAWKAIANETMSPFLTSIWKTSRKFSTSAVVVTQEMADVCNSPVIKTAIIDNSDIKILLDQSNHANNFQPIQDFMSLTPKDRMLIMSINRSRNAEYIYKEVFIKIGANWSGVYATEVSEEEAVVYESEKLKKAPFLMLAERLDSFVQAAHNLAVDMRNRKHNAS